MQHTRWPFGNASVLKMLLCCCLDLQLPLMGNERCHAAAACFDWMLSHYKQQKLAVACYNGTHVLMLLPVLLCLLKAVAFAAVGTQAMPAQHLHDLHGMVCNMQVPAK
jgi:hypothetical protein